ncbi:hypothetical protein SAMN04488107_1554 [Geodermatophilus saharensis]|uniref:Uncharacterized protein n=1 Tax=Geodermatophilus saharensis TaxID=1137994 RepID=A0A239C2U6_9ACTN|nr:hypothetical protein SAMN04488107_1554 [Geodermatophilus saharensis]
MPDAGVLPASPLQARTDVAPSRVAHDLTGRPAYVFAHVVETPARPPSCADPGRGSRCTAERGTAVPAGGDRHRSAG